MRQTCLVMACLAFGLAGMSFYVGISNKLPGSVVGENMGLWIEIGIVWLILAYVLKLMEQMVDTGYDTVDCLRSIDQTLRADVYGEEAAKPKRAPRRPPRRR